MEIVYDEGTCFVLRCQPPSPKGSEHWSLYWCIFQWNREDLVLWEVTN